MAAQTAPWLQTALRDVYMAWARGWSLGRRGLGLEPWTHLVVCGFPRSGTSLLYNMLSATLEDFECQDFEVPARTRLTWAGHQASKNPLDIIDLVDLPSKNVLGKRLVVIIT